MLLVEAKGVVGRETQQQIEKGPEQKPWPWIGIKLYGSGS